MIFTFLIVCYCLYFEQKRPSPSTPKLPEDFVKKQRAYFADIDAFELAEEEVSETDLDWELKLIHRFSWKYMTFSVQKYIQSSFYSVAAELW